MKILKLFSIIILLMLFIQHSVAAETEHALGQLMIQANSKSDVEQIVRDLSVLNGERTELRIKELVSEPMKIWLLTFNYRLIDEAEMLIAVNSHLLTRVVQYNHIVSLRATPQ